MKNLNKHWKLIRRWLAASCLLATGIVAPLTTKQLQNTKQSSKNQDRILVNTPLATKNGNNVNTLSEVTNGTIGAQELFDNRNIDDVTINYTSDNNEITIDSADGPIDASGYDLTMIDSIGGVTITSIGEYAFDGFLNRQISCNSLTLPSGLETVGWRAFYGCSGLTSITLPSGLNTIASSAFYGCSGLTSITLPSGLTSIGTNAFCGCSGLKEIHYPGEETTGSGMTTKTWTAGSTTWLARSFWDSDNQLIGRMIEIDGAAYTQVGCLVVGAIDMSASGLSSIGNNAFYGCSGLTSIDLPSELKTIGDQAFADCSNITSMSFPSSVTSIGQVVFGMSTGVTSKLQSITFNWTNPASMACINDKWLMGQSDYNPVATFYVPKNSLDEYNAYVADTGTCPAWWATGSAKHFEAIPDPVPPGPDPSDNNLNLGIALGVSLGTCIGIPGIIGLGFLIDYKTKEKKQNKQE